MVWSKVVSIGAAYLAPYIVKAVKKKIAKEIIYGKIDDYVGEEDFVEDNIFGIKELNKGKKALTVTPAIIYWKKMSANGLIMIISFCG